MLLLTCDAPAASQDADGAQELYERMLQLHPHDAGALCDYGSFLYEVSILTKPEGKGCRLWGSKALRAQMAGCSTGQCLRV